MWVLTNEYELVNLNYFPRVVQMTNKGRIWVTARRAHAVNMMGKGVELDCEEVRLLDAQDTNVSGELIDAISKSLSLHATLFSVPEWVDGYHQRRKPK